MIFPKRRRIIFSLAENMGIDPEFCALSIPHDEKNRRIFYKGCAQILLKEEETPHADEARLARKVHRVLWFVSRRWEAPTPILQQAWEMCLAPILINPPTVIGVGAGSGLRPDFKIRMDDPKLENNALTPLLSTFCIIWELFVKFRDIRKFSIFSTLALPTGPTYQSRRDPERCLGNP